MNIELNGAQKGILAAKKGAMVLVGLAFFDGLLFVALGAHDYASREAIVTSTGLLAACAGAIGWFGLQGERLRSALPWVPKHDEGLTLQARHDKLRAREEGSLGFSFFMLAAGFCWLVLGNALLIAWHK
ncbi:MAG: hypothetical protein IOD12_11975 [Silvanigrellales bacterium]|nr:hypothetical protein [Silvanigrellales bacterium]